MDNSFNVGDKVAIFDNWHIYTGCIGVVVKTFKKSSRVLTNKNEQQIWELDKKIRDILIEQRQ